MLPSLMVVIHVLRRVKEGRRGRVTMRAMVLNEPKRPLELRDVPRPKPGRGQLLVRVRPAQFAALIFTWSMANCRIRSCR